MKPRQRKLFDFLRNAETNNRKFTLNDASSATGLAVSSLRTYVSKKLKDRWLTNVGEGYFKAEGLKNMTEDEFSNIMTQNLRSSANGYDEWRHQLTELVSSGIEQGHPVTDTLQELFDQIEEPDQH